MSARMELAALVEVSGEWVKARESDQEIYGAKGNNVRTSAAQRPIRIPAGAYRSAITLLFRKRLSLLGSSDA